MQTLNTMQTDIITGGAIESTETLKVEKLKDEGSSQSGGSYIRGGSGSISCCSIGIVSVDIASVNALQIVKDAAEANANRINNNGGVRPRL